MMIGGIRGDDCEGKGWLVLLFGSLQYLVPRDGHCLRAKLNLNETKKRGWCRGCSMAEPTTEGGGGVYWQPSNERMPCQKGGMIPHNKVWWHTACCQMHSAVPVLCELGVHTSRERSVSRLCPYVGQELMFEPEILVESHHLWCILF